MLQSNPLPSHSLMTLTRNATSLNSYGLRTLVAVARLRTAPTRQQAVLLRSLTRCHSRRHSTGLCGVWWGRWSALSQEHCETRTARTAEGLSSPRTSTSTETHDGVRGHIHCLYHYYLLYSQTRSVVLSRALSVLLSHLLSVLLSRPPATSNCFVSLCIHYHC